MLQPVRRAQTYLFEQPGGSGSGCVGHVVVRFYGEHSSMWVRLEDLTPVEVGDDSHLDRLSAMRAHPKLKHKYGSMLCCTPTSVTNPSISHAATCLLGISNLSVPKILGCACLIACLRTLLLQMHTPVSYLPHTTTGTVSRQIHERGKKGTPIGKSPDRVARQCKFADLSSLCPVTNSHPHGYFSGTPKQTQICQLVPLWATCGGPAKLTLTSDFLP